MSEGAVGFLLLVSISCAAAMVAHWMDDRLVRASFVAAGFATLLFQVAAFLHAGHLDPFFPIAVVVGGFYAFVIALAIGWLFRKVRQRRHASLER